MTKLHSPVLRKFETFDSRTLRADFPQIDLFQLSPGRFRGWIFSSWMEICRITVGSFNQAVLCEGRYNPDTLHIGFILSSGHSAVVEAHEYDDGTVTIHRNAIAMHEVFPADLNWIDIAISEKRVSKKLPPCITKPIAGQSQVFLKGSRKSLSPLIQWANESIKLPANAPLETELLTILTELLSNRLVCHEDETAFTVGDRFRMRLLEATHKLSHDNHGPLSLAEICAAAGMKPRTLQKYFHEIYGMGPTEYFRIRRLNDVRSDLLAGDSQVSQAAYHRGVTHLSRFAGRYKTHFGERPSETRKRVATNL